MLRSSKSSTGKIGRLVSSLLMLSLMVSTLLMGHGPSAATSAPQEDSLLALGFTENFDGVSAPTLPTGWTSTGSGSLPAFVTSTSLPDTSPNSLFIPDPPTVGRSEVVTPPIQIGSLESHVIFRNFYDTEATFDGGVLEIKIGAGNFQDIQQAGGQFLSGGYNATLSTSFSNPLGGRQAWAGNSGGYVITDARLPASAAGQTIQLRWVMGTDASVTDVGWRIDSVNVTNTITAENSANIVIPESGTAATYPSTINVSNLIGSVSNFIVVLNDFSHAAPDDVDLLLVGPNGRRIILMSDVGGTTPVTNLSLTIQDSSPNFMPDEGPLTSASFKPTNIGADDNFPSPAPGGPPTGNTLSVLNGMNPNGTWSLYLVDDNGNNAGSISGGWGMLIVTDANACALILTPPLQVFPITGGSGNFDVFTPFGCEWTATSLSGFIDITSPTTGAGGNTAIEFTVEPNMLAGRTGVIQVSNGSFTRNFTVQQPSGCPFALDQETQNFGSVGGSGSVQVTAAGVCSWTPMTKDDWIDITSGTTSGNGTAAFTVAANQTGSPRTGTVTIGARTLTITQSGQSDRTAFDFDGDAKADLSVFRPGAGAWHISNSSNGSASAQQFGLSTDRLAPADYDGDGRADLAIFRDGTWYLIESMTGTLRAEAWGTSGDDIVPADYDGDGKADLAVWRPAEGTWYIQQSSNGLLRGEQFGTSGDRPVMGDYDGDGKADLAVFRPSAGAWHILKSSDGTTRSELFGVGTDRLAQADYDGDGRTDLGVYRASSGTWYLQQSMAGPASMQFGLSTDVQVPADYDGDGKADLAVYRGGTWHIVLSVTGLTRSEQWGVAGDKAVPAAFGSN